MIRKHLVFVFALILLLVLSSCTRDLSPVLPVQIREFTARDALDVLGIPKMANMAPLEAIKRIERSDLLPYLVESMDLIRAAEALANGATAKGVTVLVIDDFSAGRFRDGRYHGEYVSAIILATAPQVRILTCDAWRYDLGGCLFEANRLADKGEIQIVNMSLGIVGSYCEFLPTGDLAEEPFSERPFVTDDADLYEPQFIVEPDDFTALEHWVRDLRNKGVVVVSSAGNEGYARGAKAPGCWSSLIAGAVYDAPFAEAKFRPCTDTNVVADDRTCWSNYGNVFAPGWRQDVFPGGIAFGGTSAAAPFSAGTAALVIGTTKLKGEEAARKIIDTAVTIKDRFNTGLVHRRIDVVAATGVTPPTPPPSLEKFLDKNKNCVIDDPEILEALMLWITQKEWAPGKKITDAQMIDLLSKWIKQSRIC